MDPKRLQGWVAIPIQAGLVGALLRIIPKVAAMLTGRETGIEGCPERVVGQGGESAERAMGATVAQAAQDREIARIAPLLDELLVGRVETDQNYLGWHGN